MHMIETPSKYPIILLWLFINAALTGFLVWSMHSSYVGYRIETNEGRINGRVVDLGFMGHGTWSMVLEYQVGGQTFFLRDGRTHQKDEIGSIFTVRYDRSNPEFAQIDDAILPLWLFPLGISIVIFASMILLNLRGWKVWKAAKGSDGAIGD